MICLYLEISRIKAYIIQKSIEFGMILTKNRIHCKQNKKTLSLPKLPTFWTTRVYLFKVNKRNTRTMCEVCSKLTIKTPERLQWRQWRRSCVFIVKFEQISHIVLVFLLLTLNKWMPTGLVEELPNRNCPVFSRALITGKYRLVKALILPFWCNETFKFFWFIW